MHRVQNRRAAIESLLQEENPISLQITDIQEENNQTQTENNPSNDKRHRYTIYTANEKDVDRIITVILRIFLIKINLFLNRTSVRSAVMS